MASKEGPIYTESMYQLGLHYIGAILAPGAPRSDQIAIDVNMVESCKYVRWYLNVNRFSQICKLRIRMMVNNETDFHKSVDYIRDGALVYLIRVT